ncbi:MAG TPA: glycosyltransferase family 2 protein [Ktedonobacterales bacterium]|nr:glycosyltransferase family 2 protein [Ktedonobacterales bacterium]
MSRSTRGRVGVASAWVYAAGVIGFYAVAARRTRPIGEPLHATDPDPVSPMSATLDRVEPPLISVIVPARNEERNIVGCVESLLAQSYSRFEVIVVDDGSTDGTPALLTRLAHENRSGHELRVVRVETLPEGWAGKPHALHMGTLEARGDWLLFTDADTRHRPGSLAASVMAARSRGLDMLSLGTMQDLPDFWGRVLMPLAYMGISLMYPERAVNDPKSPVAIANGQFILIQREMYERVGGYAAPELRATILDDRDLAMAVKRDGGRMAILDGRELVSTRMYQTLGEHWDGWGKNAYAGSRGGLPFFVAMLVGLPAIAIVPFVLPFALLSRRHRGAALAGGAAAMSALLYRARLNAGLGVPRRYAWTHPLGAAIFTGILARSFWRVRSGRGVRWRGRTYQP